MTLAAASVAAACGAMPGWSGEGPTGFIGRGGVQTSIWQLDNLTAPHGPRPVALTFDDGPNPAFTYQILDILDRYHVRATFFVIGQQVARYPEIAREIVRRGHAIANHSWSHPSLARLSGGPLDAQVANTDAAVLRATGRRPSCVRPPMGAVNANVTNRVAALNHVTVNWTVDPFDWKRPGAGAIASRILSQTRPGAVILMHDGGGNRSQTVAALPTVIEGLRARGFEIVPTCLPFDFTAPPPTAPPTAPPTTPAPEPTAAPTTAAPTTVAPTSTTTSTTTTVP